MTEQEQSGICHFCGEADAQYWSGPDGWACAVCSENEIAALQGDPIPHLRVTLAIADLIRYHTFSITPDGRYSWLSIRPPCQTIPTDAFLPPLYQGIEDIDERIKGANFTVTFSRDGEAWEEHPTVGWPMLPHEDEPIAIFTADEEWYFFQGDHTGEYYMAKEPTKDTAYQEGVYMARWNAHRNRIETTVEGQMRYELETCATSD